MKFLPTQIAGVFVLELEKFTDDRGYFARSWCVNELNQHGLNSKCVQINTGFSHRAGTLRGLHYQLPPKGEVKIVRCTRGQMFDVAVDLRPDSPTRGAWVGVELSAENGRALYIPEGCAHGYQTLVDDTEMLYTTSEFFSGEHARGQRYDDPAFEIAWPLPVSVISTKDQEYSNWIKPPAVALSAASL